MSKHILIIALILVAFGVSACGGSGSATSSEDSTSQNQLTAQPINFDETDWGDGLEQFLWAIDRHCADLWPSSLNDMAQCCNVFDALVLYGGLNRAMNGVLVEMTDPGHPSSAYYSPERVSLFQAKCVDPYLRNQ